MATPMFSAKRQHSARRPFYGSGGAADKNVTWRPRIKSARLVRNNHHLCDELTVTLTWIESGVDPAC